MIYVVYIFVLMAVIAFIFTIYRNISINKQIKWILDNPGEASILPGSAWENISRLENSRGNAFLNMIPFVVIAGLLKFIFVG